MQASARLCRRCGRPAVSDEPSCRGCGSFLAGNNAALVHGKRRRLPVNVEASDLYREWAGDLGGVAELTAAQKAVLRRVVEADRVAEACSQWLTGTQDGPSGDRAQRVISALLSASGAVYRGAALLGLERKQRPLPSLDDYLNAKRGGEAPKS